jgi:hypothetical protein
VSSTELTVTSKHFFSEAGTGLVALVVEELQEETYEILHRVGNALVSQTVLAILEVAALVSAFILMLQLVVCYIWMEFKSRGLKYIV